MLLIILPIVLLGLLLLIESVGWAILAFSIAFLLCCLSAVTEQPDETL